MQDMNKRHEQDLKNMQTKIHQNTDAAFNKFKEAARDLMARQQLHQPATSKQVTIATVLLMLEYRRRVQQVQRGGQGSNGAATATSTGYQQTGNYSNSFINIRTLTPRSKSSKRRPGILWRGNNYINLPQANR